MFNAIKTLAAISSLAVLASGPANAQTAGRQSDPHAGHDMSKMSGMAMALKSSSPANGSTVRGSPSEIAMTFPHAMTIQSVTLTNAQGRRVSLNARLPKTPTASIRVPVSSLTPGAYQVAWRAGGGEHAMNGTFRFRVQ